MGTGTRERAALRGLSGRSVGFGVSAVGRSHVGTAAAAPVLRGGNGRDGWGLRAPAN